MTGLSVPKVWMRYCKLYMNDDRKARDAWRQSKTNMIEEAKKFWAKMK